jgi:hypothetical protein
MAALIAFALGQAAGRRPAEHIKSICSRFRPSLGYPSAGSTLPIG